MVDGSFKVLSQHSVEVPRATTKYNKGVSLKVDPRSGLDEWRSENS
jgi:hypothetical protein